MQICLSLFLTPQNLAAEKRTKTRPRNFETKNSLWDRFLDADFKSANRFSLAPPNREILASFGFVLVLVLVWFWFVLVLVLLWFWFWWFWFWLSFVFRSLFKIDFANHSSVRYKHRLKLFSLET